MSRYIDAEWLLNFFEPYPNDYQTPLGLLRACVDDAPTIDAVEVVRCKDCRKHNTHRCHMAYDFVSTDDDDYCSYGVKETDHE